MMKALNMQLLLSRMMRECFQTLLSSNAPVVGVVLSFSVIMSGCGPLACCASLPIRGSQGSVHYLVIGLGLLSVPKPEDKTAVLATKMQTLGVGVSDQAGLKVGIGYASSTVVAVPDGAEDVRVEVSQKLGGSLIVDTPKANLTKGEERKKEMR